MQEDTITNTTIGDFWGGQGNFWNGKAIWNCKPLEMVDILVEVIRQHPRLSGMAEIKYRGYGYECFEWVLISELTPVFESW